MRITDLVKKLKEIHAEHGDLRIRVVDDQGWWGMGLRVETVPDEWEWDEASDPPTDLPAGEEVVVLDITAEPDPDGLPMS